MKSRATVTIQDKDAPVVFAWLAPRYAAAHQVNVRIPAVSLDAAVHLIVIAGEPNPWSLLP